jgi:hypothetical protein
MRDLAAPPAWCPLRRSSVLVRLALAIGLLVALPARAAPACVEHADGGLSCTAEGAKAVQLEIIDLRKAVAVAVAREQEQRDLRAADAKKASAELVAARVRAEACEEAPAPSVLPWVAGGAAVGVVVTVALVVATRR